MNKPLDTFGGFRGSRVATPKNTISSINKGVENSYKKKQFSLSYAALTLNFI